MPRVQLKLRVYLLIRVSLCLLPRVQLKLRVRLLLRVCLCLGFAQG